MGSLLRISELVEAVLGPVRYADLSGPSHAEEVFRRVPTAVAVGSNDGELANEVQSVFMNHVFRVYTSDDVIGVELGGALKNVYAIAAGICDGMELGDNSKAALMTRAIAEFGISPPATWAAVDAILANIGMTTDRHGSNSAFKEQTNFSGEPAPQRAAVA